VAGSLEILVERYTVLMKEKQRFGRQLGEAYAVETLGLISMS
jgi:hypothetical protein